jgi:Carboxypeptidase regulatory-like domain/TonB-dependent Receptor Plug Domain
MLLRRLALALCVLALGTPAFAQSPTGRVNGRVLDAIQGQPLPGVTVSVVGTPTVVYTDVDGRYALTLPLGRQQIKLTMPSFDERTIDVDVVANLIKEVDATLALAGFSEEITVTGQSADAQTSSMAAQLLERRRANAVTDNLGSQEMKANADSNAANALARVTGLSVVGNQHVFVRGLGERYSNTTLNGSTLPSTEPERKVVSLDMFPAGQLDSVTVVKTYTPDRSAEFAGGLVEIVPSRLPSRPEANFSYSFGGNSQAWGKDVPDHTSGGRDWLGLTNNDLALPAGVPNRRVTRGGIFTPELGLSQAELKQIGDAFPNEWTPETVSGKPYQGFSGSFGNRWGAFGLSVGLTQSVKQDFQQEDQVYYRTDNAGTLTPFSTYDYEVGAATGSLSSLVNVGYALNASHRLNFQSFTSDKGRRETRTFSGFNDDSSMYLQNARLLYLQENLRSFQFGGDHYFQSASNSRLDWRASYARSSRDEPDIRETLYEATDVAGPYFLADESQSGLRMFNDLSEKSWDFALNWSTAFVGPKGLPIQVKFGPAVSRRERDFSSRRFRFVPIDVVRFDLTPSPEALYSSANIGPVFELREETRATDFYSAEQRVAAGYGMVDVALTSRARLIAGGRVENFRQTVDTQDLFAVDLGDTPELIRGEIKQTDVFPTVNFVQDLGGNKNLRVGFSQTVNRPEFRELAPFEFTDIVGGRATVGNPDLQRSLIRNVDARWEWFPGATEVVAASVFFKSFDKPIERFVEPTAQLRTSYTNAKSARNIGIELEARKQVHDHVTVGANYTFVDSSITLESSQTNVLTSLERPLAGTSKQVFNGVFEVFNDRASARLLVNYTGERIADVGSLGLPDILEDGRPTVDFVVSARLHPRFNVRFLAENLGNRAVRFSQGGLTQREFTLGRVIQFQFGIIGF